MSGCHVPSQNEKCNCIYCLYGILEKVQGQITGLTEMYKYLSIQIASYTDDKVRQMNENIKLKHKKEYESCHACKGKGIVWG